MRSCFARGQDECVEQALSAWARARWSGSRCGARAPCRNGAAFRPCTPLSIISARTGPIWLTKACMNGNAAPAPGRRGMGTRPVAVVGRGTNPGGCPAQAPPHPRAGGGGGGARGGAPRGNPRGGCPGRAPPRSRVPRADGEAAGACRIGRGGNLGPPGKSARAGIVRQRGIRNSDFAAHRLPNSCARRRLEAQAPCPERNRSHLSNSDKACIRPRS